MCFWVFGIDLGRTTAVVWMNDQESWNDPDWKAIESWEPPAELRQHLFTQSNMCGVCVCVSINDFTCMMLAYSLIYIYIYIYI